MKYRFICELPADVQEELRKDAREILLRFGVCNPDDVEGYLDDIMNEKIINVIGYEDGLIPPEKYIKYIM